MSKWKLITGEDIYGKYDDFLLSEVSTEGNLLCVSDTLLAGSWQTGSFATVAVFKKDDWHRIPPNINLIRAHKQQINDIKFSPFLPNILSTSSDDYQMHHHRQLFLSERAVFPLPEGLRFSGCG